MTRVASAAVGRGAAPGMAAGGCVPGRGALVDGNALRVGVCPGR